MLLWCMGSTLFQYTFHLCLWHKAHHKSQHISKKYPKAFKLLRYLQCLKLPFLKNLIQASQSNLLLVHMDTLDAWKKTKPKGTANLFIKCFFNGIFLCCHCQCFAIWFFLHLPVPLTHWSTIYVELASLHVLFGFFIWTKHRHLFFTDALPTLFTTLCALSVDVMSSLKVTLTVSSIITWSLEPCGIWISICWLSYAMFGMLSLAMCSLLSLKANCVLCSIMGSNFP